MQKQSTWRFSIRHNSYVKLLEEQTLWNQKVYNVWIPLESKNELIKEDDLIHLENTDIDPICKLKYLVTASRIKSELSKDVLLAPLEGSLIPLPHQLHTLKKAISSDHLRLMLADEVGLGKTIEAGLIIKELKLRGLIKRILIVAPAGLTNQWASEMQVHFNEQFHLIYSEDIQSLKRIYYNEIPEVNSIMSKNPPTLEEKNIWEVFDQVIVSLDSVKPITQRQGWTKNKVNGYNRERFESLISADWDLVVIDEAHKLGGSSESVARFRLGKGLTGNSPSILLLTATPHQGKTDHFIRLMSLLDEETFIDRTSIESLKLKPFIIRNEKRKTIDNDGNPLFKPRVTRIKPIKWSTDHSLQEQLYDDVTNYVKTEYNRAKKEKRTYVGFLMVLMQRLVSSSTQAIRVSLEKRLEVIKNSDILTDINKTVGEDVDWWDLNGQDRYEKLINRHISNIQLEHNTVERILDMARRCEATGPDARAMGLEKLIYQLQREENDPNLKVLVFTEFVETQKMLKDFLEIRGFKTVHLNGSMDLNERIKAQLTFAQDARVMVSTDAGGEGLNLQFAHIVVNYDLPWNPMRVEQRIGRVDRIGQTKIVRVFNFVFENSVEYRVQEILEEKLTQILNDFGVDKTSDVLDTAELDIDFEKLYMNSISSPETVDENINTILNQIKRKAENQKSINEMLGDSFNENMLELSKSYLENPIPFWVEQMTNSYLEWIGGRVKKDIFGYSLTWPDGRLDKNIVFDWNTAQSTGYKHLTLEDPKIRELISQDHRFIPGQSIPFVHIKEMATDVIGLWSLWCVELQSTNVKRQEYLPLFINKNDNILQPTAHRIWDRLIAVDGIVSIQEGLSGNDALTAYQKIEKISQEFYHHVYKGMLEKHQQNIQTRIEKGQYAFDIKQEAIEKLGLDEVKNYRQNKLQQELKIWKQEINQLKKVVPNLYPIIMLQVKSHDN